MNQFQLNQFQLVAQVVEREALRYTPAGTPIVSARLVHSSQQLEAKVTRLVEFEISALAVGEISGRFTQLEPGQLYQFTGFMARKNRNNKSLIFHLTDISESRIENKVENKPDY